MLYNHIRAEDRVKICDLAWERGVNAAKAIFSGNSDQDIYVIMEEDGIHIEKVDVDQVSANIRIFCEYSNLSKSVTVYSRAISIFAEQNHMSVKYAEELILAHEYYHFLEQNGLGNTADIYRVKIKLFSIIHIGESGIRALSEIGANGFARTYWELRHNNDM